MRRTWVGIVLLALLLILGIFSVLGIHGPLDAIADGLETASTLALSGSVADGAAYVREALQLWTSARNAIAAFTDHDPLERIDAGFALLELYAAMGDNRNFSVLCLELSMQVRALGDAHSVRWWNIL